SPQGAHRAEILRSLADALARAGRGLEAAEAYLQAADSMEPQAQIVMRREAALQLLLCGRIDAGSTLATETLRSVGLVIPRTTRTAWAALLVSRARLWLRGIHFREVREKDIPLGRIERMDHLWALSRGLSMVDVVRGAEFGARHLLLALKSGDPRHVALGLAVTAGHVAATAPRSQRARALMEDLDHLDSKLGDPVLHAYSPLIGAIHAQGSGAWRSTLALADEAERRFTENCTGVVWEIWTARLFGISSLFYLGRWRDLDRRITAHLAEALDRGNAYALTALRAPYGVLSWLARGDHEGSRRHIQDATARWSIRGFHLQHYWMLMAETFIDLHAGDGATAWARLRDSWPDLKNSLLLRLSIVRTELLHARAASAAAAALSSRNPGERRAFVKDGLRSSRSLKRVGSPMARSLSRTVRAALAAQDARNEQAALELESAIRDFDGQEMVGHAAAARLQLARLRGLPTPPREAEEHDFLGDREAFVRMLAPGFPLP
ncbi:MAG TPA: hypothetical protein VMK12_31260, partial [Anaeromyxobacteraceae bacterium]|nr:hypothetical protein [Anaeromyxobacteraceae bacterium]